ncbi:MAG: hypothetical protein LC122_13930 [Chitinophagales bacterium]|nr:hypothetical protein [Chitinophagales bacterium]
MTLENFIKELFKLGFCVKRDIEIKTNEWNEMTQEYHSYWDEEELPPVAESLIWGYELDKILNRFCPNINYLTYRTLINRVYGTYTLDERNMQEVFCEINHIHSIMNDMNLL